MPDQPYRQPHSAHGNVAVEQWGDSWTIRVGDMGVTADTLAEAVFMALKLAQAAERESTDAD